MPSFESGVSGYVRGRAIVQVYFPIDWKGNHEETCSKCFYYSESSKRCLINNEKPEYPNKYVGSACPLLNDADFIDEIEKILDEEKENNQ